jgi:hypothetical protein
MVWPTWPTPLRTYVEVKVKKHHPSIHVEVILGPHHSEDIIR